MEGKSTTEACSRTVDLNLWVVNILRKLNELSQECHHNIRNNIRVSTLGRLRNNALEDSFCLIPSCLITSALCLL